MSEALFWIAFAFVGYVYAGYPLVLMLWRALASRPVRRGCWEPRVSVVMAASNERESIAEKVRDCLALDYPRDRLQLIVSLDGPTDGTELQALAAAAGQPVEIVHSRVRRGKAAALNAALGKATGELVVFTDARQRLDRTAVRELAANFRDDSVGAASGELILGGEQAGKSEGVGLYWRYEKLLRAMESEIHSMVGATGAIYAIRRELFRPLGEGTILDDVFIPMSVVLSGKRVVFDRRARAYERSVPDLGREYRRKVRTLAGNYQLLAQMPSLLNPRRNPVFFQFVSHKLGRLLVPFFLLLLFWSNLFLLHGVYAALFGLQSALYLLAGLGFLLHRSARPGDGQASVGALQRAGRLRHFLLVPYTFVMFNWAAVAGLGHFLAGRGDIWRRVWSDPAVSQHG